MGPLTGPEKPQKKVTGLLIGCIVAALVLVAAVVVLVFVFLNSGKEESDTREPEVLEERDEEDEEEPEENDTENPEDGEEQPDAGNGPDAEKQPEKLTGEDAFLAKQASGISGTVDYGTVSYEPQSAENDIDMTQEVSDRVAVLMTEGAFDYDPVLTGTLYSMSEDRDMNVKVYYHPETYEIERITTLQPEDDHFRLYEMIFVDGKLAIINDVITDSGMDASLAGPDYDPDIIKGGYAGKAYVLAYAEDALGMLVILRENGEQEEYSRYDLDSMDDGVQSLYLAREAEYLNRAYITYAAVTE